MAELPLVSVITPSFNQNSFLEATLRSVLEQAGASIEYLVVDGGSNDGSVETIRRYAGRLAWWVSEPDRGQAEAINKGFRRAQGEIVAWLNSDDLYLPGAVAAAAEFLQAHPAIGMVFGDALTIDPHGRPLNRLAFGGWGTAKTPLEELLGFRIICQPAVFVRRSVLEQAGYLNDGYHFMLDHHLWIRIARLAPVAHLSQVWAAARHHPAAKNVAQAAAFGQETRRIYAWMQSQPDLAPIAAQQRKRIEAGVYRLSARYLLDGGQPGPALRDYGRALLADPRFALQHKHRMVYALAALIGLRRLGDWASDARRTPRPDLRAIPGLEPGWPGLNFDQPSGLEP